MKTRLYAVSIAFTISLHVMAQDRAPDTLAEGARARTEQAAKAPRYKPPTLRRLAKRTRIESGAVRGQAGTLALHVLAPTHTGLTTHGHPRLAWYTSKRLDVPVEITLEYLDAGQQVRTSRTRLEPPFAAGLHVFDTARHGVEVTLGHEYVWNVLVLSGRSYSSSPYAEGTLRRIAPPAAVATAVAEAPIQARASIYAEAGLWFDALEALFELAQMPGWSDTALAQLRALLAQQALPKVSQSKLLRMRS